MYRKLLLKKEKNIDLLRIITFLCLIVLVYNTQLSAQQLSANKEKTRILFILDCSQSMSGKWAKDKKINIARKFLGRTIDSLGTFTNVEMALRVYGHQSVVPPQDCNDTRLEVAFAKDNGYKIKRKMNSLWPKGTTPIANSLAASVNDFPPCDKCRNVIILITDGIEACDGDPCAVSVELQKQGIILKPFIIGIGLEAEFEKSFECLGNVYNASTEERFEEVLEIVITHALTETSMQVNLIDEYGMPSETNVPMSFYNRNTNRIKYNFVHTINHRGNPDTLIIDPLIDYMIKVHTMPPVFIDSLRLAPGKHNIIAADAPQGELIVKQKRGNQYKDLRFIIRKQGEMKTLCRQQMNMKEKYITGSYDIEIPTIPITYLYNTEVRQSEETQIIIPQPGVITFLVDNIGVCELYFEKENDLQWAISIDTREKFTPLILLPGYYTVIYRPLYAKATHYTIVKRFKIESGKSSSLRIF